MKTFKLTALLLFSPLYFFAQSLTGLWTGSLSNDSSTVRKDQSYEIALTEYRGKVYGYSRSEFIVNDTLYYIVKRVKGTIEGEVCEVKDDEIISYNFRGKLDKGVRVVNTFRLNKQDSAWYLDGKWKTNATKKYYALTGKIGLQEEKDMAQSKLFPHLEELKLADDVAFYKEQKNEKQLKQTVVAVKKEEPLIIEKPSINKEDVVQEISKESVAPANTDIQKTNNSVSINTTEIKQPVIKTEVKDTKPVQTSPVIEEKKTEDVAITKNSIEKPKEENRVSTPEFQAREQALKKEAPVVAKNQSVPENKKPEIAKNTTPTDIKQPSTASTKEPQKKEPVLQPNNQKKTEVASNTTLQNPVFAANKETSNQQEKNDVLTTTAITNIQITNNPVSTIAAKKNEPVANTDGAATGVKERKSEFAQEVTFRSDSLELALYDNGEIDGDTVSVLLNGQVILSKQGLKASAIRKTIYVTPETGDVIELVLYAENLGKYPPNTGLLVVRDGDDVYNVRFSADLQRNAGIILRKKK